ncbi:MAG: hypothetical protein ABL903_08350 [Methylococcales bacterium]
MTKFEAETYRKFTGYNGEQVTLKEWIANQIDSSWLYSHHWKEITWVEQAKEDCQSRISQVKKDLDSLYNALTELKKIDV